MKSIILGTVLLATSAVAAAWTQAPASTPPPVAAQTSSSAPAQTGAGKPATGDFAGAALGVQGQLESAVAELAKLREQVAQERLPMNKQLNELEAELLTVRQEYQQAMRLVDTRTIDLSDLRQKNKDREEEQSYLAGLFSEYVRNFESRLHIAELQRYRTALDAARLASENRSLTKHEVFQAQAQLLDTAVGRLSELVGGARFEGQAVGSNGLLQQGKFVQVGPVVLFQSADGLVVGTVEQRLGSLEPTVVALESPEVQAAAGQAVAGTGDLFPIDPTMGNAHKVAQIKEGFVEHIIRGGVVMYPILALAAIALLVALFKFFQLVSVPKPSKQSLKNVLDSAAKADPVATQAAAKQVRGPTGRMLERGAEHLLHPPELVEEVMYESVLETRLKLHRFLPFVAITSSSAPLLGLLGTVTGIMNTFSLMTVFGTGDVKTLSSGISEALITTEYGLYVAIPSLLLYAYLSRKAKSVTDGMEKAAMTFVNQARKSELAAPVAVPTERAQATTTQWPPDAGALRELVEQQVREILLQQAIPPERASGDLHHARHAAEITHAEGVKARVGSGR